VWTVVRSVKLRRRRIWVVLKDQSGKGKDNLKAWRRIPITYHEEHKHGRTYNRPHEIAEPETGLAKPHVQRTSHLLISGFRVYTSTENNVMVCRWVMTAAWRELWT